MELVIILPGPIFELSEAERAARCDIGKDMCALDRSRFFIRGLLPLPVHGRDRPYRIGLWAEVDEPTFGQILRLWKDPAQADTPLLPGTLTNDVPLVPPTAGLPIGLRLTGPKTRPEFFIANTEHPLALEQRCGIDPHRALEYSD